MPALLLADRLSKIVDDDELTLAGQILSSGASECVETRVGGVMDFHFDRLRAEKSAELIQCHAPMSDLFTRQDRFSRPVQKIVLRERVVGIVLGGLQGLGVSLR